MHGLRILLAAICILFPLRLDLALSSLVEGVTPENGVGEWQTEPWSGHGPLPLPSATCGNASENVISIASVVKEHNLSGFVWMALAIALSDEGCTEDALICAEVSHRLFTVCGCSTSPGPEFLSGAEESASLVRELAASYHKLNKEGIGVSSSASSSASPCTCCGGRADVEGEKILGGRFLKGGVLEEARAATDLQCGRYFAQCQQTRRDVAEQQDFLLHQMFGNMRGGTFVDVGAVDGHSFSNTLFFERNLGWKGVCFEPNPDTFPTLQRIRPNSMAVHACASNETATRSYLHCRGYTRMLSGMMHLISPEQQEMIRSETQAHGGGCNIIEARVVRLADVLADAGISHIDLLSIDTEGSELQVLTGMDWERISVGVVVTEMARPPSEAPPGRQDLVDAFLLSRGFNRIGFVCTDMVHAHSSFNASISSVKHCSEQGP